MLYLSLPNAQEYFKASKLLNLVLDTIDRRKDLFLTLEYSAHILSKQKDAHLTIKFLKK